MPMRHTFNATGNKTHELGCLRTQKSSTGMIVIGSFGRLEREETSKLTTLTNQRL